MRAHEFLFEQSITDQDAKQFLLALLASAYSLKMPSLPMKGIIKSLLEQGYLRDAKWVMNTINSLPDDDNLIVDKAATNSSEVVFVSDDEEIKMDDMELGVEPDTQEMVDNMAKSALDRRFK